MRVCLAFAQRRQPTFADLCETYLRRHARPKKRSAGEDERKINTDLLPELGSLFADDLSKADIIRAVDRIADRGAGIAANRTLALLRKLYNWGMAEGLVGANPAAGIPMRAKERTRERVLTDDEIVRFWSALDESGFELVTADALRLQLLLGARIREVTDLVVSELQLEGREPVWRLPRERAKSGQDIVRPLPALAVSIIKRRLQGTPFVFASTANRGRPITPRAPARAVQRAAQRGLLPAGFTPHDLRRTAATNSPPSESKKRSANASLVMPPHAPTCSPRFTIDIHICLRCDGHWKLSSDIYWRLSTGRRTSCHFVKAEQHEEPRRRRASR